MKMSDVAIIRREVEVTTVPYGEKMNLLPGQEVLVTQAMGGSFSLNVMGNLVYLDGKDADAIGREAVQLPSDKVDVKKGDDIDEALVWSQLRTIYDPEIPVNIVDLGLIYDLGFNRLENNNYHVGVQMTLTAPGCGMGPVLVQEVEDKLKLFANIDQADVVLVFDPPWNSEMMTEEAKLELGLF
ncbi:putative Fe-S cluster assembly protein SufT [Facilibium subflavum]|uniref:putative Fe-S cluster assembly protein SufT n=1 Tax=Facilibium subflavum TaxID=2219058 RepID=UPI000E64FDBF|nr:putative Fe-S cluster assembly protein SufT [Facilibium subflavum]